MRLGPESQPLQHFLRQRMMLIGKGLEKREMVAILRDEEFRLHTVFFEVRSKRLRLFDPARWLGPAYRDQRRPSVLKASLQYIILRRFGCIKTDFIVDGQAADDFRFINA